MKEDERQFLVTLAAERPCQLAIGPYATDIGKRLGMHWKRAEYLLDKWTGKGWWECGVTLRSGWLTEKGLAAAEAERQHAS